MPVRDVARLALALGCSAAAGAVVTLLILGERLTRPVGAPRRDPHPFDAALLDGTIAQR